MQIYNKKISEMIMDTLQIIAITLLFAYGILAVIALLFSDGMIFPNKPSSYTDNQRIIKIPIENGKTISGIFKRIGLSCPCFCFSDPPFLYSFHIESSPRWGNGG